MAASANELYDGPVPEFDPNRWYEISSTTSIGRIDITGNPGTWWSDQPTLNGTVGLAYEDITNPLQTWQIIRFNSSCHMLRPNASDYQAWLRTGESMLPSMNSSSVNLYPFPKGQNPVNDTIFWQIRAWGDGTYFLTNAANGRDWLLLADYDAARVAMVQNTTMTPFAFRLTFNQLGPIDNQSWYSHIAVAPTSTSSSSTSTASVASITLSPSNPTSIFHSGLPTVTAAAQVQEHIGLSTGASAGIGTGVGGAALFISVLAFMFWKRRKGKLAKAAEGPSIYDRKELHAEELIVPAVELGTGSKHLSVELPAEVPRPTEGARRSEAPRLSELSGRPAAL